MKKLFIAASLIIGMIAGAMVLSSFSASNVSTKSENVKIESNDDGEYIDTFKAYGMLCSDDVPHHVMVDVYRRGSYDYYGIIQEDDNHRKREIQKVQENGSGRNAVVHWQDCYYWFRLNWR